MNKTKLHYDQENDILYFVIREGEEHHFREIADGVTLELDENNQPIGLEIFNATKVMVETIGRERLALAIS